MVASAPQLPQVSVITTAGTGSVPVPAGFSKYTAEAIGGGGNGFGSTTNANKAGGGGGRWAISAPKIAVSPGNSIFYSVGTAAQDSWVNTTNAPPSLASTGCLAKAGTNAASGVAGNGAATGSINASTNAGGTGATGNNAVGGGAAGASGVGSGQTAGTDTTGLSAQLMGGGTGGASLTAGTAPGGGGGSSATAGTNPAGAVGRVRITFYVN
jgi:hypothetical protein